MSFEPKEVAPAPPPKAEEPIRRQQRLCRSDIADGRHFDRAGSPTSALFVDVGDRIAIGQTVSHHRSDETDE